MHKRQQKKGKVGLCILSSAKKKPFLADPSYLKHKGFKVCDTSDCGIDLWYLPFDDSAAAPKFKDCAKHPKVDGEGYVLYYTNQCPFNAKYVPVLEEVAAREGVKFKAIRITTGDDARNAPTPFTTYSVFLDGKFVTNEQMNEARFLKLISK